LPEYVAQVHFQPFPAGLPPESGFTALTGSGDAPRRTSRVGKQRIMMVDGVPVLKLNNYDLEGGERSVFDQELNRAPSAFRLRNLHPT
jgi:hypothetical protein